MEAEKTYQNKVARTIQQKRSGEGALEFADNRQGGILLHNPVTIKTKDIIQKVDTNLHVQNGPSCWLTVFESMAATFPELKLNTLRNILTMYTSKTEIKESKDKNNDKGYIKALRVTKAQINTAFKKIKQASFKSKKNNKSRGQIRTDRLYNFLRKISPSVARIVNNLSPMKGFIRYSDIKKVLYNAIKKINQMLIVFKDKTWEEQVAIISNQTQTQFSKDNNYNAFETTMSVFTLPVWAGINKGIKGRQLPYENTDFTDKDPQIDTYNHAIQIVDYGKEGKEWVKYKDPNRGNIVYTVKWDQFKCFAGDSHIYLFSYNEKNKVPQLIQD